MGYRSEVAIVMTEKGFECLCNRLENIDKALVGEIVSTIDCMTASYENDGSDVLLYAGWTKWYENFNDVKFIEDTLRFFMIVDIPYMFLRIGGNIDDIEEHSWLEEELYYRPNIVIQRHIDLSGVDKK